MEVFFLGQAALVWRGDWAVNIDALESLYEFFVWLRGREAELSPFPAGRLRRELLFGLNVYVTQVLPDELWVCAIF